MKFKSFYMGSAIAFDWALTVLSDPDFHWIEVDSVSCPVDDVVIGKADGTLICCQCKKKPNPFQILDNSRPFR
ncbi:hypothetical protein AAW31_16520 [Nitrosomonas communis]|uniref:Uncharacterized protein n=1 Tax=Nitrosomonas communis TaxID=44574 RepID=A0A0F7KF09_9PROT|nr:hypothetical protein AAW31_16520 [Nitrosomonas communis]